MHGNSLAEAPEVTAQSTYSSVSPFLSDEKKKKKEREEEARWCGEATFSSDHSFTMRRKRMMLRDVKFTRE